MPGIQGLTAWLLQLPWTRRSRSDMHTTTGRFDIVGNIPAELSMCIFRYLPIVDLVRAMLVSRRWYSLCHDPRLWHDIVEAHFNFSRATNKPLSYCPDVDWMEVYKTLHETRIKWRNSPTLGVNFLVRRKYFPDTTIPRFLVKGRVLSPKSVGKYITTNPIVLRDFMWQHDFSTLFLADALRVLFQSVVFSHPSSAFMSRFLNLFTDRYCECNSDQIACRDTVYLLSFSVLILSNDMHNPGIKNKMTKREFIRNTRQLPGVDDDFSGHLYDNVWVYGHILGDTANEDTTALRLFA